MLAAQGYVSFAASELTFNYPYWCYGARLRSGPGYPTNSRPLTGHLPLSLAPLASGAPWACERVPLIQNAHLWILWSCRLIREVHDLLLPLVCVALQSGASSSDQGFSSHLQRSLAAEHP